MSEELVTAQAKGHGYKVKKIWVYQSFMLTCRAVRILYLRQPTVLLDTYRQKLRYGGGWDVGRKEAAILGALLIFQHFLQPQTSLFASPDYSH